MTGYTQSFDRKGVSARGLIRQHAEYNPTIVKYYSSNDELLHVEETWRGATASQTIYSSLATGSGTTGSGTVSGTGEQFAQEWPDYSYSVTTEPWVESTASGTSTTSSGVNHVFIPYPY